MFSSEKFLSVLFILDDIFRGREKKLTDVQSDFWSLFQTGHELGEAQNSQYDTGPINTILDGGKFKSLLHLKKTIEQRKQVKLVYWSFPAFLI